MELVTVRESLFTFRYKDKHLMTPRSRRRERKEKIGIESMRERERNGRREKKEICEHYRSIDPKIERQRDSERGTEERRERKGISEED